MREFIFSILDLNNRIWPQALDVDRPVQQLLPGLAQRLDMPHELNYVLIPAGSNQPLDGRWTLAQLRIPVGAQLYLRPQRDPLLKKLLDELYDQAKDELKDRLLDQAKAKLKKVFDLDPWYPDPLHLKEQAWGQPVQVQYQQQFRPPVKAAAKTGWIIAGVLGGGAVLLVGGVTVVALVVLLLRGAFDRSSRSEPVLGTGDVQVTLRWSAPVDLDLHVIDPAGQEIWYQSPSSSTGGILDVDANGNCQNMVSSPVENVFWPYGSAPSGGYQVLVVYYMTCGYAGPVDYEVTVRQNDQVIDVRNGTVTQEGELQRVTRFSR
jgi:hypothetical protein